MADFGNISITPAELKTMAERIVNQRNAMEDYFRQIGSQMTSLESNGWDSKSGKELRDKFERLQSYYNNKYPPAMQSYIDFLRKTAEDYEKEEADRSREVAELSNMGQ